MKHLAALALSMLALAGSGRAFAQDNPAREASRHFQRGVELHNEGDFRGALVEFKKAYGLLPRASVLYNIGQTEYQLREYAEALHVLERFLAETGPTAAHRAEVEETVGVLKGRVGEVVVIAAAADCDVTIDDAPAGRTPVSHPVLVSIGRRKVSLLCAGRAPVSREIEIAAGETGRVDFARGAPSAAGQELASPPEAERAGSRGTLILSWTATALLFASTIGAYTAMKIESGDLDDLKHSYPVTRDQLDRQASLTNRLALTGDILALATVAAASVSTYLTLSARGSERRVHVGVAGSGLLLHGTF